LCQEVRSHSTSTTGHQSGQTQDVDQLKRERDALTLEVEILRTQMALLSHKAQTPVLYHQQHGMMTENRSTNTWATNASSIHGATAGGGEIVRTSSFESLTSSHGSMNDLMFNLDEE